MHVVCALLFHPKCTIIFGLSWAWDVKLKECPLHLAHRLPQPSLFSRSARMKRKKKKIILGSMSKCGGAEGKTRNKAFRVVEARSGRYDKKVTCIKKNLHRPCTLYLTTQASSFFPLCLQEKEQALSLFLARQKNILQ